MLFLGIEVKPFFMHTPLYHSFHIPVMGLAYTIDSPIKVARFGISSVISIMEDRLIELMRSYYYPVAQLEYKPITPHDEDYRAKRITDYLNLVNAIVQAQVEKLRASDFEAGSEIVKYVEMLPEGSTLKSLYQQMRETSSPSVKEKLEAQVRSLIKPGSIDVNIMTKTDRNHYNKKGELIKNGSDAVAALRGYAKSNLHDSSVIFSAGMNPRLYNYLEHCPEFDMQSDGEFSKKITIKVSDYRSALIQGKYLAKKGLWVSEFRIESGLNCGGHAFATDGYLLGPILEEFKSNKQHLTATLFEIYIAALQKKNKPILASSPAIRLSVQGGIGTHEEDTFLHAHYNIESTGWGTPFLLVPEATTVDEDTLKLLCAAKTEDVVLSHNSPLGVRFHYLKGTSSDLEKHERIAKGKPGSPCTEKHLAFNTEFTEEPICTASRKYQKLKIQQLQTLHLSEQEFKKQIESVLERECLCVGLSNAAAKVLNVPFIKKLDAVTICPGPNIAHFDKVVSLQTMIDYIYGRTNIIAYRQRPHMFIAELKLYIQYYKEQLEQDLHSEPDVKRKKYLVEFYNNISNGIEYYRQLPAGATACNDAFYEMLDEMEQMLTESNERFFSIC